MQLAWGRCRRWDRLSTQLHLRIVGAEKSEQSSDNSQAQIVFQPWTITASAGMFWNYCFRDATRNVGRSGCSRVVCKQGKEQPIRKQSQSTNA